MGLHGGLLGLLHHIVHPLYFLELRLDALFDQGQVAQVDDLAVEV